MIELRLVEFLAPFLEEALSRVPRFSRDLLVRWYGLGVARSELPADEPSMYRARGELHRILEDLLGREREKQSRRLRRLKDRREHVWEKRRRQKIESDLAKTRATLDLIGEALEFVRAKR